MYFKVCNMYPKVCNIYPKLWDKKFFPKKKHPDFCNADLAKVCYREA